MTVSAFAIGVAAISFQFKGSVTSWCRTEARNKRVGGHPRSKHLRCLGADLVFDTPPDPVQLLAAARLRGLAVLDEQDHFHIQPARKPNA